MDIKQHWESVFSTKRENEVSWYQPYPRASMELLGLYPLSKEAHIVDVGGGDSRFVDALLDAGYQNLWVLDISGRALDRARARLGVRAAQVRWIESDVLDFEPPVEFGLWHDRAAFHFLLDGAQVDRYVSKAAGALSGGGSLILGTFSEDGPQKCSGMEVRRYSEGAMASRFEGMFDKVKCIREEHPTPFNSVQNFLFCNFRRRNEAGKPAGS